MIATLLALTAMTTTNQQGLGALTDSTVTKVPFDQSKWKLAWSDEFNTPGLPNPKYWGYEEGYVRNNEKQFYTTARKENAEIKDGKLIITARKDNYQGHEVTSAGINTYGKKEFLYGRLEVRAKIPTGRGTWPAFWTLGTDIHQVGWPKSGEIDILENVGFNPDSLHANVHTDKYNHSKGTGKGSAIIHKDPHKNFHIYAVEWYKDRLEFFFDDNRYFIYRKEANTNDVWPFDKPHYVIINLAIGGAWGGMKGIDDSIYPAVYEVDYIRYYKFNGR